MSQPYYPNINPVLLDWWDIHHAMGGYVALCYVDWQVLHSPLDTMIELLERYRQLDPGVVQSFMRDQVTNNEMPDRDVLEDGSKIFHLTHELELDEIMFTPQILHEPWYDRYRVHPGSGRVTALWLWGYESFQTIYTHFNEPGFAPPGTALRIGTPEELLIKCINRASNLSRLDFETYYAFPNESYDRCITKRMDSVWEGEKISTLMPWQFIRYSEGQRFLDYKRNWRLSAWMLWTELQQSTAILGDTAFEFDANGKIIAVTRKGQPIDIDK